MKYMSNQNSISSVNMYTGNDDFIIRTEYNLKMMKNLQSTSPKKAKRFRSAFTTDQVNYLEQQFKKFPYIGNAHRKEVATALNIPERAVKIWFQNRRMKEKKETSSKEFDDEASDQKSLEFAKKQLNNVTPPSTNDQQSFSLTLVNDVNKVDSDKMIRSNITCNMSSGLLVKDSVSNVYEDATATNTAFSNPTSLAAPVFFKSRHSISPSNYMNSSGFSIDSSDKYKNEPKLEPNVANLTATATGPLDMKHPIEHNPTSYKVEQIIPEDLSANRKVIVPPANQIPLSNITSNNPRYVSVLPAVSPFYTQPYYSASGVLWKPVNMMPMTPGSSLPMPTNPMTLGSPENVAEKCCSCSCHIKPVMPLNFQPQQPTPQYIITAVQLPNPSASKF